MVEAMTSGQTRVVFPGPAKAGKNLEIFDEFKETEIGLIPVDWEVVRLGELGMQFFSGGTPSTKKAEFWDGDIPWTTSAYIADDLYLNRGAKYITTQGLEHSSAKLVPQGNLLIGTRVGVGKAAINLVDMAISQDLTGVMVDKDRAHLEFLAYAIRSDGIQEIIQTFTRGTTIKGIPRKDLIQVLIPLPPLPEQRCIAYLLNTIQREIAAQDALIAAASEVKRSLLQRLFTYGPGAEPAPTKETEIGEIPEHWDVVRLGEVLRATQYGLSVRADSAGKYPMLRMNNLVDGRVDTLDLKYVDLDEGDFEKFRVQKGDVLFNRTNSYELVGKTAIFNLDGDFTFASYLVRVIPDMAQLLPECLNYYLNWDNAQRRLKMLATRGVSQSNISATKLRQFVIGLPSLSEQKEIAHILATADCKIGAEEGRKVALQALFKSMLHQLMTGQLRLTQDFETQRRKDAETQRGP